MDIKKTLDELEAHKKTLQSLVFGKDDARIVSISCTCLKLSCLLYFRFKGNPEQMGTLLKSFIGIYYHAYQVMDIQYFKQIENATPFTVFPPFNLLLKEVHKELSIQAEKLNKKRAAEYHLKECPKAVPL